MAPERVIDHPSRKLDSDVGRSVIGCVFSRCHEFSVVLQLCGRKSKAELQGLKEGRERELNFTDELLYA